MENILEILDIPDNTKYWLVRAGQGEEYEDFKKSGIIGLRYDKLTLDEIHSIKNKPILVQEYTTYTSKKGKIIKRKRSDKAIARDKENFHKTLYKSSISKHYKLSKSSIAQIASRIENFVHKMNIGDIVIVPYISSRKFLVGVITSDTYEITIEEQQKLEAKAQKEYEWKLRNNQTFPRKHKVSISRKRRNVKWLNEVDKSELSPKLFYTITMHQSIIDISELGEYIDRILSTLYIKDKKLHLSLKVSTQNPVTSELWEKLFKLINRNKKDDEVAEAKIYVESPGFFEISQFLYENKEPIAIFIAMIFGDIDINGIRIKGLLSSLNERAKNKEEIRSKKLDNDFKEENNKITLDINKEKLEAMRLKNKKLKQELKTLGIKLNTPNLKNENQDQTQKDSDDLSDEE
ncbi:hypothetical protein [Gemella morbillorum]|uniref:hypothetical protein n=1 Tax=Gemella morbillorum TaxID=29391 RepID=UPI00319E35A0